MLSNRHAGQSQTHGGVLASLAKARVHFARYAGLFSPRGSLLFYMPNTKVVYLTAVSLQRRRRSVATGGVAALKSMVALKPDVVTFDVEMPRLNGIEVLERGVGKAPVAFVMVAKLLRRGVKNAPPTA